MVIRNFKTSPSLGLKIMNVNVVMILLIFDSDHLTYLWTVSYGGIRIYAYIPLILPHQLKLNSFDQALLYTRF